jgi:hypothetical protein
MSKSDYDRGVDAANNGLPIANPYGDTARGEEWVSGYERGAGDFRARINGICGFIKAEFHKPFADADSHLEICKRTANDFSLWESSAEQPQQHLPLWLMSVVQTIGRDEGILT